MGAGARERARKKIDNIELRSTSFVGLECKYVFPGQNSFIRFAPESTRMASKILAIDQWPWKPWDGDMEGTRGSEMGASPPFNSKGEAATTNRVCSSRLKKNLRSADEGFRAEPESRPVSGHGVLHKGCCPNRTYFVVNTPLVGFEDGLQMSYSDCVPHRTDRQRRTRP